MCSSKSFGAHIFLFSQTPQPASLFQQKLKEISSYIGHANAEIFPKQTQLTKDLERGGYRPGQFINLPYFNKTERRALNIDGTEFTFEQFIPLVESNLVDPDQLNIITEKVQETGRVGKMKNEGNESYVQSLEKSTRKWDVEK